MDVGVFEPTKSVFDDLPLERDQIWAEAVALFRCGEPLYMTRDLEAQAMAAQEEKMESSPKEGIIRDFVELKIPKDWYTRTKEQRLAYWTFEQKDYKGTLVERDRVCAAEVWVECLGGDLKLLKRADAIEINKILEKIDGVKQYNSSYRFGCYGRQKGFLIASTTKKDGVNLSTFVLSTVNQIKKES